MEGKIALELPQVARRLPLLVHSSENPRTVRAQGKTRSNNCSSGRMGEAAGGCAAICCCCPWAVMHFCILAVYRLPKALWKRKKRRRLLKKTRKQSYEEEIDHRKTISTNDLLSMYGFSFDDDDSSDGEEDGSENDAVAWDNEMWNRFYAAGFWRSGSQRNS